MKRKKKADIRWFRRGTEWVATMTVEATVEWSIERADLTEETTTPVEKLFRSIERDMDRQAAAVANDYMTAIN